MGLADFIKNELPKAPGFVTIPLMYLNPLREMAYGPSVRKFKSTIPDIDPEEKLVTMANHAIKYVPYYRERYSGTVIQSADQFKKVFDFIDKKIVMSKPEQFIADNASGYIHVTTSGTTGVPLKLLMPANRYVTEMAFITRMWEMQGWNYGRRANIRMTILPKDKVFRLNPLTRDFIFDGFRQDETYLRKMYQTMKRYNIRDIYGYAMGVYCILKSMEKIGLDLSIFKNLILTSEAITPFQYQYLHDYLRLNVISHYGHTEKLISGRSLNGLDRYVLEPAYGFTEIIDFSVSEAKDASMEGAYGELVGSTFYNFAMPLLRYRSGDSALSGGYVKDVDGVEKLMATRIDGRSSRQIVYRHDGTTVSSSAMTFHGAILDHIDGIQLIQKRRGYLTCIIKPNARFSKDDLRTIEEKFDSVMLGREYWRLDTSGQFAKTPSGKFIDFINETI